MNVRQGILFLITLKAVAFIIHKYLLERKRWIDRAIDSGGAESDPTHSQTHTVDWCNDGW